MKTKHKIIPAILYILILTFAYQNSTSKSHAKQYKNISIFHND